MIYSISVVIPNYNGHSLLQKNLPFVYSALETSGIKEIEIIVADDASTDTSITFLKSNYSDIIIVENKTNLGFAGNINSGIQKASKDLVLLLNSDVQLTDNYFTPLLRYFNRPDTFGVGSLIKGFDGENQDQAKYPAYSYGNIIGTKNYSSKETGIYTFFISGANALVDRKKILELGGFCELFSPYYGEDLDLSLHAWRSGYTCFFDKSSICFHEVSSTIKKEPNDKIKRVIKRNKLYLHYLHLDGFELTMFICKSFLKGIFRVLTFNSVYLKAFFLLIKNRHLLQKEKENRKQYYQEKNIRLSIKNAVKMIKYKIASIK